MTAPQYATVADYEAVYGDVPTEQEARVQAGLDTASALIHSYLGNAAADVEATYPDALKAMAIYRVHYQATVPVGIRTESIGSTSVTYTEALVPWVLSDAESDVLDGLIVGPTDVGASAYDTITPAG